MLRSDDIILFCGDSITDCGRDRTFAAGFSSAALPDLARLGQGYVRLIAEQLLRQPQHTGLRIHNRGVSGHRIYDLEARIADGLRTTQPTVVSILIGINDTWRRYDRGTVSDVDAFEASYRRILAQVRARPGMRIVMLEPFLLPVPDDRRAWREDLDPKIAAVRRLAAEFADVYVPLDRIFTTSCAVTPADHWLPDGVHPSPAGHDLIATTWLNAVFGHSGPDPAVHRTATP